MNISNTKLDLDFVRSQFPAFKDPICKDWSFFENAGGSYASCFVIDRLTRFYKSRKVQPYGFYNASELGGAEMDEARNRLAELMNIDPPCLSFAHRPGKIRMLLPKLSRNFIKKTMQ